MGGKLLFDFSFISLLIFSINETFSWCMQDAITKKSEHIFRQVQRLTTITLKRKSLTPLGEFPKKTRQTEWVNSGHLPSGLKTPKSGRRSQDIDSTYRIDPEVQTIPQRCDSTLQVGQFPRSLFLAILAFLTSPCHVWGYGGRIYRK